MCFRKSPIVKKGKLYDLVRDRLHPLEPIFFKGGALFSKIVKVLEERGNTLDKSGEFTHVGVVITSDILDNELVLPGKKYILESTFGGRFSHNIKDIYGKTILGVQLRDLDEVIAGCDKDNKTEIAWGRLLHNPVEYMPMEELKRKFTEFFNAYNHKYYDMNVYSLLGSAIPCLRPCRQTIEQFCHTEDWYFCSELIALLYKHLNIYPATVNEKDVMPRDMIYPAIDTDEMPVILQPIEHITTSLHYDYNGILV